MLIFHQHRIKTYHTDKTAHMPLGAKGLDNRVGDWLATSLALCTVAMRVAIDTPGVAVFFYKRRGAVEWIAALGTEKVAGVPFCAAGDNHLAFNGRLAALAAWRKEFVEIQVAVEARGLVGPVFMLKTSHVLGRGMRGEEWDVDTQETGTNTLHTLGMLVGGLWVEGYTLEVLTALVTTEAFGMEARACCRDNTTRNGQGTLSAESACTDSGWCPVGTWRAGAVVAMRLVLRIRYRQRPCRSNRPKALGCIHVD